MRILGMQNKTRFYQASTSELYGLVQQGAAIRRRRRSIRAAPMRWRRCSRTGQRSIIAKRTVCYACNGILFNHESPVRGETFVTRKITRAIARIAVSMQKTLYLGNLSALRDWGHARDYVEMQWRMLNRSSRRTL